MKIKEYLVIDPAGVVWNGEIFVQGGTIAAAADGRLKAYLHFKQVKETGASAEIATPEPAPEPATAAVELPGAAAGGGGEFAAASHANRKDKDK